MSAAIAGPWRLNAADETIVMSGGGRCIAAMKCGGMTSISLAQAEAHARLTAAAPTMRDLLDELLELHIAHHNNPTHAAARALLRTIEGSGA